MAFKRAVVDRIEDHDMAVLELEDGTFVDKPLSYFKDTIKECSHVLLYDDYGVLDSDHPKKKINLNDYFH